MTIPNSEELQKTIERAKELAVSQKHEYVTLEHLLLALTEDKDAVGVLCGCNIDPGPLKSDLQEFFKEQSFLIGHPSAGFANLTQAFDQTFQRALIHAQSSGREIVTGANILVAIFSSRQSYAAQLLLSHGLTRPDAVNYIVHGIPKISASEELIAGHLNAIQNAVARKWVSRGYITDDEAKNLPTISELQAAYRVYAEKTTKRFEQLSIRLVSAVKDEDLDKMGKLADSMSDHFNSVQNAVRTIQNMENDFAYDHEIEELLQEERSKNKFRDLHVPPNTFRQRAIYPHLPERTRNTFLSQSAKVEP